MTTYNYTPGNARHIEKNGIWFRDREGRYATFRGVNFAGSARLDAVDADAPRVAHFLSQGSA